jgi:hypothetical protein
MITPQIISSTGDSAHVADQNGTAVIWNKAAERLLWTCHGKSGHFYHFGGSVKWL